MISTKPLEGAFGVEIKGADLSDTSDKSLVKKIIETFYNHGLILIRNQKLNLPQFEKFVTFFGDIKPHFLDHLRLEGHPGILLLSNIYKNEEPIGVYEGAAFWHTDVAYEDPPNTATLVYGVEYPKMGCPTHYACAYQAYDELPDATKKLIDPLVAIHHYGNRDDLLEDSPTSAEKLTEDQKKKIKNVYHPIVKPHPITGRKALYGIAGSSFGIKGMPVDEAISLLDELKEHVLQKKYQTTLEIEKGDFAAWDTFLTLHKATVQKRATGPDDSRLLWRASMVGQSPLFNG